MGSAAHMKLEENPVEAGIADCTSRHILELGSRAAERPAAEHPLRLAEERVLFPFF